MAKGPGCPSTITWGGGNLTNYAPEIVDIAWSGMSRNSIDLTSYGSATASPFYMTTADIEFLWMEKKPGAVVNAGQLRVDILHDPDLEPPIGEEAQAFVVTFPKSATSVTTQAAWACSAFVTDSEFNTGGMDDRMTGTLTIELTGAPTFTAEA